MSGEHMQVISSTRKNKQDKGAGNKECGVARVSLKRNHLSQGKYTGKRKKLRAKLTGSGCPPGRVQ